MQTMTNKRNVLVIVGREADPPIMVDALRPRAAGTAFTLLVPATPAPAAGSAAAPTSRHGGQVEAVRGSEAEVADWLDAVERAERGAQALREAGLEVVETIVGDADFAAAAGDVLHAREIDDVVVLVDPQATLAAGRDLVAV